MTTIHDQWAGRSVLVSIPRKVAFDYNAFLKAQQTVLDRMGMAACCSGIDIRWDVVGVERATDLRIDDTGEIIDDQLDRGATDA